MPAEPTPTREQRIESAKRLLETPQLGAATINASQLGLPGWVKRRKAIEDEVERMRRRLAAMHADERERCADDPAAFPQRWRARLAKVSFVGVNELIAEHNEWFPVEAKLRWDHHTQDYRAPFGLPWREQPLGIEWALELFPDQP